MVSGPAPCDFPNMTVTEMPVAFSNSGSAVLRGVAKPPDVMTVIWASAVPGNRASSENAIAMPQCDRSFMKPFHMNSTRDSTTPGAQRRGPRSVDLPSQISWNDPKSRISGRDRNSDFAHPQFQFPQVPPFGLASEFEDQQHGDGDGNGDQSSGNTDGGHQRQRAQGLSRQ